MSWILSDSKSVRFQNNGASKYCPVIFVTSYFTQEFFFSSSNSINFWSSGWMSSSRFFKHFSIWLCAPNNPVKCWCGPTCSWLCCCVLSSECSAWRLRSARKSCPYFWCHFRYPKFLADPQELDVLPEKIEKTIPLVFEKIAHLLHVRAVELASAHYHCAAAKNSRRPVLRRSFRASRARCVTNWTVSWGTWTAGETWGYVLGYGNLPRSDSVSDGDLERSAWGCP